MKILKSKKALSPVVASIILIAVTVAVSIAVAAWMGALTIGFMATEQLQITNIAFGGTTTKHVNVTMLNTGTSPITVNEIWIGATKNVVSITISGNGNSTKLLTYPWVNGNNYGIKVVTTKGNNFMYTAYAPSS